MFDAPADTWYVWLGLGVTGVVLLGTVAALPSAAPPDATAVAETIDRVATSAPGSTDTISVRARSMAITPRRISLRGSGGAAHATLAFGPVASVHGDDRLREVLAGASPAATFDDPSSFTRAVADARAEEGEWRTAPDRLRIRRVSWAGTDVVLVGGI